MSKENTPQPIYITVEPTNKHDKLLIGRLSNYFVLLSFLLLEHHFGLGIPDTLYYVFASAAAGLEIGQFFNLLKRKP